MIREVFPGIGFERIKRKTYGKDKSSRRRDYSHKCKRRRLHFITDMLKAKDGDFFVTDWLRNRNTMEFLGVWERVYNPKFNYGEFATIRNQSGLNSFKISVFLFNNVKYMIALWQRTKITRRLTSMKKLLP